MATSPDPVCEMLAEIFKAMGHPTRLQILRYLGSRERAVSEIVQAVGAEQSNVSRHLSLLRQVQVLTSRKAGLRVFYKISTAGLVDAIHGVVDCLRDVVRLRLQTNEAILDTDDES